MMARKLYHVKIKGLVAALEHLGYKLISESELMKEFYHSPFHLHVRLKGKTTILSLHMDVSQALPPFHKGIDKGERIRKEYDAIVNTYLKMSAGGDLLDAQRGKDFT